MSCASVGSIDQVKEMSLIIESAPNLISPPSGVSKTSLDGRIQFVGNNGLSFGSLGENILMNYSPVIPESHSSSRKRLKIRFTDMINNPDGITEIRGRVRKTIRALHFKNQDGGQQFTVPVLNGEFNLSILQDRLNNIGRSRALSSARDLGDRVGTGTYSVTPDDNPSESTEVLLATSNPPDCGGANIQITNTEFDQIWKWSVSGVINNLCEGISYNMFIRDGSDGDVRQVVRDSTNPSWSFSDDTNDEELFFANNYFLHIEYTDPNTGQQVISPEVQFNFSFGI